MEPLNSCLFFPASAGDCVRNISEAAAHATDIPYLIASSTANGEYSYAASLGIPGLLLERGHSGWCLEEWVVAYCRDFRLLLNHLGCYPFAAKQVCDKTVFEKAAFLIAEQKGLWYPAINENETVKKNKLLGTIQDFRGKIIQEYYAKEESIILYYTASLSVNIGDALVAYGYTETP
jgi:predicted deacylase